MHGGEQGPISPELVLVMPPDEARRAREALPAVLIYDPSRATHERVAAERVQEVLPVEVAAAKTGPGADVVLVAVEEADRVEELEHAAAEDDAEGEQVNEVVAEAERRRELERAVAALAGRVAASEARRVATSEARRVAAAVAERVAATVLAQAAAVATEAERAAGERLEAERVTSSAAAANAGEEEREAAVEQLQPERAPEQGEAKPESEPTAERHEPKPEREPEAEPVRRFQLVESGIRPSDRTVPTVARDEEDWSYPATRPKARTIALAAALGVVAFGAGLLVQKQLPGDSTSSVANVVAARPAAPTGTSQAGGQRRTSSLSRPLHAKGNATRSSESAKPPLGFVPARVWGWKTQPGARGYHVRFFLNNRQVFSARTKETQLTLPRSFRFQAGRYRWLVRAIPKLAEPIVDTTFVLSRRSASAANRVTQPHA
jgi:hypothetical protein